MDPSSIIILNIIFIVLKEKPEKDFTRAHAEKGEIDIFEGI
jgi:hypothetical protein